MGASSSDMMVKFEEFAKGVGYEEKLRLARAYYPKEFSSQKGYSLTAKGIAALTARQKRKLTQYYNYIRPFIGPASQKVYTRNAEQASAAWRSLFGVEPPKGTLYVPVVGNDPELEYYEVEDGDLRAQVRDENVMVNRYFFADYGITPKQLLNNFEGVLRELHEQIGGARYSILTGDHLMTQGGAVFVGTIEDIIRQYKRMQNRYNDEQNRKMFKEVLIGLQAYNFDTVDEFSDYREEQYQKRKERQGFKDQLNKVNRSIKDTTQKLQQNLEFKKEYEIELKFLLSGVRGKERKKYIRTSRAIRNLMSHVKKLDTAIKRGRVTLQQKVKQQKTLIKEIVK